jgi:nucleotide-binding universal stress UspA family protein
MEQAAENEDAPQLGLTSVTRTAEAIMDRALPAARIGGGNGALPAELAEFVQAKTADGGDALVKEAAKAYSIIFAGLEQPVSATTHRFEGQLEGLFEVFDGPVAIAVNGRHFKGMPGRPLNILVPTGGAPPARLATELGIALAKATGGKLTALHVFDPQDDIDVLRGRARRAGVSVLVDARRLGKRSGVFVEAVTARNARPENAIRTQAAAGQYDLVIVGTSLRRGETKFLGSRSAALLRAINAPTLLITQ